MHCIDNVVKDLSCVCHKMKEEIVTKIGFTLMRHMDGLEENLPPENAQQWR